MNKQIIGIIGGLAITLLIAACGSDSSDTSAPPPPAAPQATGGPDASAPPPATIIKGKVIESMEASGYTYMNLDQGEAGTVWVATPSRPVEKGQEVGVIYSMTMENFESKVLGRTFDKVIFASGFESDAAPAAGAPAEGSTFAEAVKGEQGQAPAGMQPPTGSSKSVVPFSDIKVDKAKGANAHTVGELFDKKSDLSGKTVVLRGKVMKVSKNIMGTNWIHLQDGTGNPMNNTHDLVVTSGTVPEADAVVTVTGALVADKDFGAGYKYAVIIENATIGDAPAK